MLIPLVAELSNNYHFIRKAFYNLLYPYLFLYTESNAFR